MFDVFYFILSLLSTFKLLVYSEAEEEGKCSLYFSSCAKKRNENFSCFKFKFLHIISNIFKPNQYQQSAADVATTLSLDTFKKSKGKTFSAVLDISGYVSCW